MEDQRENQTKTKKWKETLGLKEKETLRESTQKDPGPNGLHIKLELHLGEIWAYQISHEVLNNLVRLYIVSY